MVNEWTRDDLPEPYRLSAIKNEVVKDFFWHDVLDEVAAHMNANHPKPHGSVAVMLEDIHRAQLERDRLRRAHEIVEQERDHARESLRRLRDETDFDLFTVRDQLKQCRGEREQMTRERDEWKARAEAAEARTAPAVSRADVAEALSRCLNPEMWDVTFPSVVNEVCDLFGVEAGQAVDPLLDKAQEFAALADWELTDREAELLHTVARHVLGQEDRHVDL